MTRAPRFPLANFPSLGCCAAGSERIHSARARQAADSGGDNRGIPSRIDAGWARVASAVVGLVITAITVSAAGSVRAEAAEGADAAEKSASQVAAEPASAIPRDGRLQDLRTLDTHAPFSPPAVLANWQARAQELKLQVLVNLGLWPMPTRGPLQPTIHGRREFDGYSVEKVYFESLPGFYVTGSLYRPLGRAGKLPGVLCPHGHWSQGRFHDAGDDGIKGELASGGERFAEGGRNPLQSRCAHLARLGCVVFIYDMIGYADSQQIPMEVAHGYSQRRPAMETAENWGFFSVQAELHQQHIMGLQTFNSIRALDFLTSLPDVDATRVGVTGASGGGTQTFVLAAIDDRPRAVFPAVMVSTGMQGGCTCENACGFRTGTGNVELAALFAPKPLGLTAANDWTREMTHDGFPELQQIYRLYQRPERVHLTSLIQFGHNYNAPSRAAMYAWFNEHLGLGHANVPAEREYTRLSADAMTVWDAQHPRPASGQDAERAVVAWWHRDSQQQLMPTKLEDAAAWQRFGSLVQPAWQALVKRRAPTPQQLQWHIDTTAQMQWPGSSLSVRLEEGRAVWYPQPQYPEILAATWLTPEPLSATANAARGASHPVVVWVSEQGRSGLWKPGTLTPVDEVQELLAKGCRILAVDLLGQGSQVDARVGEGEVPLVDTPRQFAGFTFGYNPPRFTQRVHDVLTATSLARQLSRGKPRLAVVGLHGAGRWVAVARAADPALADASVIDTQGFTFQQVPDWTHPEFMHGAVKYGDLWGACAVACDRPVWIQGLSEHDSQQVAAAFRHAGQPQTVHLAGPGDASAHVTWLWKQLQR